MNLGPGPDPAELRSSHERLQALISNVPGAIYRCALDDAWTMELISDEIERISGHPAADFVGNSVRTFASVIHPDDRDGVARDVDAAVSQGLPFELEYRIMRADGSVRWVLERGQAVHGADGRPWLDGAIFDVTERREAEDAVRRADAERIRVGELRASRMRIIEAADAARRNLERDLHDGAQQRLVALALTIQMARAAVDADPAAVPKLLDEARAELNVATHELRELARGIHPAVLTDRGLEAALVSLAERAPVPVQLAVALAERLPPAVEAAVYFVVSEALTNVARYASASGARVDVQCPDGRAIVEISDDGMGGADPERGSGLRGLADRVGALDGSLTISSPAGAGTVVRAELDVRQPSVVAG